jgi:hypothetical protein
MALGLNTNTNAEIVPHIRYDARAGRLFRNDREQKPDGGAQLLSGLSWAKTAAEMKRIICAV